MSARALRLLCVLALCATAAENAGAHSPGSSHLSIVVDDNEPQVAMVTADLALVDLLQRMPLDLDADGGVSWGEVRELQGRFARYFVSNFTLAGNGEACALTLQPDDTAMVGYTGVDYVSLRFRGACAAGTSSLAMNYGLFFDIDPAHHSLAHVVAGGSEQLLVMSATRPRASWSAGSPVSVAGMVQEGIRHILIGYDHLLFLLMLILPAITTRHLRASFTRIAGIVTAFTLAHSITLALAATGVVALPARPVEVAIAASIVCAAAVNVWRPEHRVGWQLAFCFGLLHGFGFAGALAELGLASATLAVNLLAFNVGVEAGQLLVVSVTLPLLLLLARWPRYRRLLVPALSAAGAAMGMYWTLSRL